MKKIVNFTFLAITVMLITAISVQATQLKHIQNANNTASGIPAMPYKVIINQQNAHVYAQCMARVIMSDGQKVLVVPFPKAAENIQLSLPMRDGKSQGAIMGWTAENALPFKPQGAIEKQRITFESMHDSLNGALLNLQAQKTALLEGLKDKNSAVNQKNAQKISSDLALVGTRIASTQRQIDFAKQRALQLQDTLPASQQYIVRIDTPLAADEEVLVSYAYTLSNSFWKPVYFIDASTKNNNISVQLLARITQNSDLDWHNVDLELSTVQGNERAPLPLSAWIIRKGAASVVYAKSMAPPELMMARGIANDAAGFDESSAVAHWSLPNVAKIPEGVTTLKLSLDTWDTPLLRIARPFVSGNTVWLSAKPKLSDNFYPAGEATFLLDGAMTGKGSFAPKANEAEVFFGADPLVTVETKQKSRKTAEKGIIGKEQTWQWTWIYDIVNKRNIAVDVRLEEPQTQGEDAAMSISYADEPKPEVGPENTFIWNVQVPAKGTGIIKRNITLKAPSDMKLDLGR